MLFRSTASFTMKFAKELEQDLVPGKCFHLPLPLSPTNAVVEWRAKYLDYKQGKKRVKAVSRAISRIAQTPKSSKLNPREYYRSNGSPYLARKAPPVTPRQQSNTLVEDPESNPASDSSDQVRKPILIHKRGSKGPEGVRPSYGSFVPTDRKSVV